MIASNFELQAESNGLYDQAIDKNVAESHIKLNLKTKLDHKPGSFSPGWIASCEVPEHNRRVQVRASFLIEKREQINIQPSGRLFHRSLRV